LSNNPNNFPSQTFLLLSICILLSAVGTTFPIIALIILNILFVLFFAIGNSFAISNSVGNSAFSFPFQLLKGLLKSISSIAFCSVFYIITCFSGWFLIEHTSNFKGESKPEFITQLQLLLQTDSSTYSTRWMYVFLLLFITLISALFILFRKSRAIARRGFDYIIFHLIPIPWLRPLLGVLLLLVSILLLSSSLSSTEVTWSPLPFGPEFFLPSSVA
jgi:hypothetical protein